LLLKKVLQVRVQPGASREELVRVSETEFKAKLTSAPEKGKANEELLKLLSEYLQIPRTRLKMVRGQTARIKLIEVSD
jgi:hypothetical protein